jgi:hypothetical protein
MSRFCRGRSPDYRRVKNEMVLMRVYRLDTRRSNAVVITEVHQSIVAAVSRLEQGLQGAGPCIVPKRWQRIGASVVGKSDRVRVCGIRKGPPA